MPRLFGALVPEVLRESNFRTYWLSHLSATSGMWFWRTLGPILVFGLTKDPRVLGLLGLVSYGPVLVFSYGGGYLADYFDKRKVAALFQTISAMIFIVLGLWAINSELTVFVICFAALVESISYSLCKPAIQSLIYNIVKESNLTSAVSVNTAQYSIAQLIGPVLASLILFKFGATVALFSAALLYIPMVYSMSVTFKKLDIPRTKIKKKIADDGTRTKTLTVLLLSIALGSVAIEGGVRILAPQVASDLFSSASGAGYLISAQALGGILGILLILAIGKNINELIMFRVGSLFFGLSIFLYSFSTNFSQVIIMAIVIGACNSVAFNIATAFIHKVSTQSNRGRSISLHSMALLGSRPATGLVAGGLSSSFGWPIASRVFAIAAVIPGIFLVRKLNHLAS